MSKKEIKVVIHTVTTAKPVGLHCQLQIDVDPDEVLKFIAQKFDKADGLKATLVIEEE